MVKQFITKVLRTAKENIAARAGVFLAACIVGIMSATITFILFLVSLPSTVTAIDNRVNNLEETLPEIRQEIQNLKAQQMVDTTKLDLIIRFVKN